MVAEPSDTEEFVLRAMARNYTNGHAWDHLDEKVCIKAADEIRDLRALLSRYGQTEKYGHGETRMDAGDAAENRTISGGKLASGQAEAANGTVERQQAIGAAIERACAELPDGWLVEVMLERGYGGASLISPEGSVTDLDCPETRDLAAELRVGIDAARTTPASKTEGA